jgi:murein DD-endopeptidase MepM/ murein hydrolase activator NlpD
MSKISVKEGDQVEVGHVLGLVGSTGDSTGNHLHYEVRVNSEAVDPLKYTVRP